MVSLGEKIKLFRLDACVSQFTLETALDFGYGSVSRMESNQTISTRVTLKKIADYLKLNNLITVEIDGHTDYEGNAASNLKLSEERARSVYAYLTTLGIDKSRLSYHGFGQSKPLQPNDTELHKALNRRTEFVIVALK